MGWVIHHPLLRPHHPLLTSTTHPSAIVLETKSSQGDGGPGDLCALSYKMKGVFSDCPFYRSLLDLFCSEEHFLVKRGKKKMF